MSEREPNPYWRQVALGGNTGAAQRHAKSQHARTAILIAAGEQFADLGYLATSLSTIAERCGLTKGSLYFHFRTKQDLADTVVNEMLVRWSALRARIAEANLDPLRTLIAEIHEVIDALAADPILRGGVRLVHDPSARTATAPTHLGFGEEAALERLSRARCQGLLRADVEVVAVARLIVAMLVGHRVVLAGQGYPAGWKELRSRVHETLDVLLPAVASPRWMAGWHEER